jgi:RyR domain
MKDSDGLFPLRLAWLIPLAAAVTVGLGVWGWLDNGSHVSDALYRSLALFEINNDAYTSGVGLHDIRFRIGRWTGAGVVFSSILALAALLHEHLATALAKWTKQQVVVVGGTALAAAAFEAARRDRRTALWLGADAFSGSRFSTIALEWPPGERSRAIAEHARRTDHVLIAENDDAEALTFAKAARAAAPTAHITVLMSDLGLAEDAAATLNDARTRVLASGAVAARALTLAHPPFLIAKQRGHARIHALILGFGQTGQAIARDLIVNCRTTYLALPRLTVIDPAAEALEGALRVRAPELDACAECRFIEGEVGGRAVRPDPGDIARALAGAGPITAAYICLADDASALAAAAMLQSLLRALDIGAPPVFVRLRGENAFGEGGGRGLGALIPFGDLYSVLDASEFLSNAPDAVARAFSEAYRANLPARARDDPDNRSAFPWDRLDETYRQSTRDAAAHIPAKFASAGIDAARWRGVRGLPRLGADEHLFEGHAELERFAELEHERWMAQRRMDGWRATDADAQDRDARRHPSLAPYETLSDEVKEFDRVFVRQTEAVSRDAPKPA